MWKPRIRPSIDEWAETRLWLSQRSSARPGPFRWEITPYLRTIAQCFNDSECETIVLCCASQVGKTMLQMILMGYIVDVEPSPTIFMMPNTDLARSFAKQRLKPFFADSFPEHLPTDLRQFGNLEMDLNGTYLNLVGSNSPAAISSKPMRFALIDEADKAAQETEKEASAIRNVMLRTNSYANPLKRKIIITSTPTLTTMPTWEWFMNGSREFLHVPCPHCGLMQQLVTSNLKFPDIRKDDGSRNLQAVVKETTYACESGICPPIKDAHKPGMLRQSEWVAEAPENRRIRSFQLSALYSPFLTFGHHAEAFLKGCHSQDGQREFKNSWEGVPFVVNHDAPKEGDVLAHVCEYRQWHLDEQPRLVIIGADCQRDEIYYTVWAYMDHGRRSLIAVDRIRDLHELAAVPNRLAEARFPGPLACPVYGVIDSGDGVRTHEIYKWCLDRDYGFTPCKGRPAAQQKDRYKVTVTEPKEIGAVNLFMVNTDYWKHQLHWQIRGSRENWRLPSDIPPEFPIHMTSEAYVEKRNKLTGRMEYRWTVTDDQGRNHWLDATVYADAFAHYHGAHTFGYESA